MWSIYLAPFPLLLDLEVVVYDGLSLTWLDFLDSHDVQGN